MRKLLFASLYALVVAGFGFAIAANITKSVQLSQDPSGPVQVDTQNSVYFPAHVNALGSAPTIAGGCGTSGALDANSTDVSGLMIEGTGAVANGCSLTWRTAYVATPFCTVTGNQATPVGAVASPGGIQFIHGSNTQGVGGTQLIYAYVCIGGRVG